jgi:hypothetical protein
MDFMDILVSQVAALGIIVDTLLEVEQETYADMTGRYEKLDQMIAMLDSVKEQLVKERGRV